MSTFRLCFAVLILFVSGLSGCGDEDQSESDVERIAESQKIADSWMQGDKSAAGLISSEDQLKEVVKIIEEREQAEKAGSVEALPLCAGYWGDYAGGGEAPYLRNNRQYRFYWSSNCAFPAPGNDCGPDHNDNMVSIWMGPDFSRVGGYRVDGATSSMRLYLQYHVIASYLEFRATPQQTTFGNAYVCIANWMNPANLRFGRVF